MSGVKNIKVSLKVNKLDNFSHSFSLKHVFFSIHKNFYVIRDKFTFILFKPRKHQTIAHLNITKIPHFDQIQEAVLKAKDLFSCVLENTLRIDNITFTHCLRKPVNLPLLYNKFSPNYTLKYNNDLFPGLFYKSIKGTAVIFHTGNINILGCKSLTEIKEIILTLEKWIASIT